MTSSTSERKSLKDLRESTSTLFAKNNTPHKITCNTDKVTFEMDPHEIRIMPKECLNEPGFQRLWMRKSVTISDDPEMENQIQLGMGGVVEGLRPVTTVLDDGTQAEITPQMEQKSGSRDFIVGTTDNDPTSRNYGMVKNQECLIHQCGEPVLQTANQAKAGEPPLCPLHQGEAHQVLSTPQPDGTWSHAMKTVTIEPTKKT